jgi:hypothetical protein
MEVMGTHKQAYRLELPPSYRIHDVFHVSLLELWYPRADAVVELDVVEIDGEEEFEVESVLAYREGRKGREYLVHWKGYSLAEDTWEPVSNLKNALDKLREYMGLRHDAVRTARQRSKNNA